MSKEMRSKYVPEGGRSVRALPCGRKAKGVLADGKPGCGLHIAAEARSAKAAAQRERDWEETEVNKQRGLAICETLGAGRPEYGGFGSGGPKYTHVLLSLEEAEALVGRLKGD